MGTRLRRLSLEVARFSAVNVVATAVALVLFNLLGHGLKGWFDGPLNGQVIYAYLLANSVGTDPESRSYSTGRPRPRAISIRCTSEVPSPISRTFASR